MAAWEADFRKRLEESRERAALRAQMGHDDEDMPPPEMREPDAPRVGQVTDRGRRLFESKRRREHDKATNLGVEMERLKAQLPEE
jgi:hypothetical protein